jgi:hypothetical protein
MALDLDAIIAQVKGEPDAQSSPSAERGIETCEQAALRYLEAYQAKKGHADKLPRGWDFNRVVESCRKVRALIARGDGRGNIHSDRVIVVALGLGRDSFTILGLLKDGKLRAEGHRVRPQDVDAIVFSDPGAEWWHSYEAIADAERLADELGIPFYWLKKPLECDWQRYLAAVSKQRKRIREQEKPGTKISAAFGRQWRRWRQDKESLPIEAKADAGFYHLLAPIIEDFAERGRLVQYDDKNCTVNHKIEPIRRFMEDLSIDKFGIGTKAWTELVKQGKRAPHLSLVGIAWDEHSGNPATKKARDSKRHPFNPERHYQDWKQRDHTYKRVAPGPWWVDEAYPLAEGRVTKAGEQPILERHGLGHIRKSGCFMCPFQPIEWYWLLGERARLGDPWAVKALARLVEAQRHSIEEGVGIPRIRDKRIQGKRRGLARLRIEQAIPVIEQRLIQPMISSYRQQGLTDTQAREQVYKAILRKDYAQGCKLGSVNALHAWASDCGCHP